MDSRLSPEHHRVIVVGTGFNGLSIAKTYLDIDASVDVILIDCESSVGGVWSRERIYPGLHYETPTPTLDWTEMSMADEFGMEDWSDVTGYQVNEFIVRYATKFDLLRRCRFNTMALEIERDGPKWRLLVQTSANGWKADKNAPFQAMTCDKLILATGITSRPITPDLDLSSFTGFSFHSVEMGRRHAELTADSVNHVTVVGGHKSAVEAVGTCAQAGKKVEWLIRADGGGPTWLFPSRNPDGTSLAKLASVRAVSVTGLSVYHSEAWLNRFLHSGRWWIGTRLISQLWSYMTKNMMGDKYLKSENGSRLKPDTDNMFWLYPGGTITHERDLETLRLVDEEKLIHVDRAHIISAKSRSVTLNTGATIETDGIVWCTGWELSNNRLFSPDLANELGLPVEMDKLPLNERKYWDGLDTEAGDRIVDLYKVLRSPPVEPAHDMPFSTFRLFRYIIPPKLAARGDNSIVVMGNYVSGGQGQLAADVVSLFAVAYLEDMLPPATKSLLRDTVAMHKDIALVDAFRRKRYLGFKPYRMAASEWLEHIDQAMADLGLRADRKRMRTPGGWRGVFGLRAWYREWFEHYLASDYKGIVQEFLADVKQRQGKNNGQSNGYSNGKIVKGI